MHTDDELIIKALEIRDDIDAMKKHHGEELEPYESALQDIENALLARMVERQAKSIGTVHGTAYRSHQLRVKMVDRLSFIRYILEPLYLISDAAAMDRVNLEPVITEINQRFSFITNHVAKEEVKEYIDTCGSNPPGIETTTFTQCNIRKA